jgi:hypothetical protein
MEGEIMSHDAPARRWRPGPGLGFVAVALILLPLSVPSSSLAQPQSLANERSRLAFSIGLHGFVDADMENTYGMLPVLGLRWTAPLGPRSQFLLGVGYAFDQGDPYYGVRDFETDENTSLRVVPIELGVRVDTSRQPTRAFYLGTAIEYLWAREEGPSGDTRDAADAGWGWGAKILAGPEWQFAQGRWAVGCEVSLALRKLSLHPANGQRTPDLSGLCSKAYVSARL